MSKYVEASLPEWMTKGKTTKTIIIDNDRPITCLHRMWKTLIFQIKEDIYDSLVLLELFPEENHWSCDWWDIAKKGKSKDRNWTYINISTKYGHKD